MGWYIFSPFIDERLFRPSPSAGQDLKDLGKIHASFLSAYSLYLLILQVIANDVDVQRCNLLIHQTKRMCSANLIVTNHEAQHFPNCSLKSCTENSTGEEARKHTLQFDRVLCDVPCTGDGTLRKAPDIWRKWYVNSMFIFNLRMMFLIPCIITSDT